MRWRLYKDFDAESKGEGAEFIAFSRDRPPPSSRRFRMTRLAATECGA
jgi:hypothetical protein